MAQEKVYPVYLIAGFLDSGKTSFINGILSDGFAMEDRTLLLQCEEGEMEYEKKLLHNVTVLTVDDQDSLTPEFLEAERKKCKASQIIVEYNGMWQIQDFYVNSMPPSWVLYQIIATVEGPTFETYTRNMASLMSEKLRNADMICINRCTDQLCTALRQRNLRLVNRRADIYFENVDGTSEDYLTGDECPFDLNQPVVDIPDDDFGVWYVDVMDHPDRWAGKEVHMKLLMCHSKKYPGIHCPGRFAMVCCENDIQFLGLVAKGMGLKDYKNRDWVEVTARMAVENHDAYQGKGPVMHVMTIAPCGKPAQDVVTF